jgi:hypothetical protein
LFMSSLVYIYRLKEEFNKIINEHVSGKNKWERSVCLLRFLFTRL